MTRHGFPINEYYVTGSVNTGIKYSFLFHQFQACVAAGLDLQKWWNDDYGSEFKAHVVAWYEDQADVKKHTEDAVNKKVKQDSKRRR